jgi:hypothetical protein
VLHKLAQQDSVALMLGRPGSCLLSANALYGDFDTLLGHIGGG